MNVLALMVLTLIPLDTATDFDIPDGIAPDALREWIVQAHIGALWLETPMRGVVTHAVRGRYRPIVALRRMIEGTPIDYTILDDHGEAFVVLWLGVRYCDPSLGPEAPMPPCVQIPSEELP